MRRTPLAFITLAALSLSACGMMGGAKPTPGEYESFATMIAFAMPGAPPVDKEKLNKATSTGKACLTQAAIDKSEWKDAAKSITSGLTVGAECKTIRDNNSATNLDTELQCSTPEGDKFKIVVDGQTQSESMEMNMAMTGKSAKGDDITMIVEFSSNRIGDCSPEAKAEAEAAAKAEEKAGVPIAPNAVPSKK